MACAEALPLPDSRQKVDELFLFWLSERSTHEILCNELSRVCGLQPGSDEPHVQQHHSPSSIISFPRPGSPVRRSPSPPAHPASRSPSSNVQNKRSVKSPNQMLPKAISLSEVTGDRPGSPKAETAAAGSNRALRRAASESEVPRFYFPNGKPRNEASEKQLREAYKVFQNFPKCEVHYDDFHKVVKALGLPLYWRAALYKACGGKARKTISFPMLKRSWLRVTLHCHDDSARFIRMLAGVGKNYLTEEDFEVLVQDIVDTHPGLAFLQTAPEFHARYVETVIGRIFYALDRHWTGQITAVELRKSNFLQTLALLEEEPDINQVRDYFSYEHFYVLYCKFWELDSDHDLFIDASDLARHSEHALTSKIIQRMLSGIVSRDKNSVAGKMSYKDFIWFLLSEEDKTTPRSIEYWFRCLDLDGDGALSLYEMDYFYQEVQQRLRELNIDCLSVENTMCQILDMINPKEKDKVTLRDLKACKLAPIVINTFMNLEKYLEYEQRDPVLAAAAKDEGVDASLSDWERYAAQQYDRLLSEEEYEQENFEDENNASDVEVNDKEILSLLR
eukprot:Em0021g614a